MARGLILLLLYIHININMLIEFSDFPEDVIDIFMSRIPLRDAVRTSILSSKWRHHWTRIKNVSLDWNFFDKVLDRGLEGEMRLAAYLNIVDSIISSHNGPIRTFYLYVPDFGKDIPAPDAINLWILSVSRCGVQNLTFQYEYFTEDPGDRFFEFPLSVFQCVELKHLCLRVIELDIPPHNFGRLSSLVSLDLRCGWVSAEILTNIILNCPLLESLWLTLDNTRVQNGPFVLTAPKMVFLSITYYFYLDFILNNTPKISTLLLNFDGFPEMDDAPYNSQDIVHFFGAISEVEDISLNGPVLGEWAEQYVPEKLPVLLEKHLNLSVHKLDIDSISEICSMFCLIKSSPQLKTLKISVTRPYEPLYDVREYEYLQSHISLTENLWSPRIVKVTGFTESGLGIVLIQVILSRCAMLEKLYLESCLITSPEAESKMTRVIEQLPRASTKAEIILKTKTRTTITTVCFDAESTV